MKYVIIFPTLLRLLFTTVRSQPSREVNLIDRLNDFFAFDHNIFLLDNSVRDRQRYIPINAKSNGRITPQTVYIFDYKNNLNGTKDTQREQLKALTNETGQNTILIVVAPQFKFEDYGEQILDEVIAIRQFKKKMKIGIFFEMNISSMEIVLQLFKWSWSNRIVNIFCAFYYNVKDVAASSVFTVFRFDPFEETFLINLTESNSLRDYFPSENKIPNYHYHPIRLWRFASTDLGYFCVNYWHNVIHIFNASISVANISEHLFEKFRYKAITEDGGLLRANENKIKNLALYPDRFSQYQLVVPHAQPYESIFAYLQNATWTVLIGYTFVVIATASLLLTVSSYLQARKRNSFVQCVVDVVNLILNDNSAIKYGQLHRAQIYIVVPLTFTGLIVTNGILSVFKSYLMVPIYQNQIKTIDELYESHISIVAREPFWVNDTISMLESITGQNDWRERVLPTKTAQFFADLRKLNNSFAYGGISWVLGLSLAVQKRLNLKSFYLITDQTLGQYLVTFPVNPDFPFLEPLNMLHQRLVCHGITKKWEADEEHKEISILTKAKRLSFQIESNSDNSNSDDFHGMFTIIWYGWIAGGIVFICELICNKFKSQINKLHQTFWMCARNVGQKWLSYFTRQ